MRWLDHRKPVPDSLRGAVVALGNFDGFHLGHQAVAGEAIRTRYVSSSLTSPRSA